MLILSRKVSESLLLLLPDGREVMITVVTASGGKTRLGIEAPREIEIRRAAASSAEHGSACSARP